MQYRARQRHVCASAHSGRPPRPPRMNSTLLSQTVVHMLPVAWSAGDIVQVWNRTLCLLQNGPNLAPLAAHKKTGNYCAHHYFIILRSWWDELARNGWNKGIWDLSEQRAETRASGTTRGVPSTPMAAQCEELPWKAYWDGLGVCLWGQVCMLRFTLSPLGVG